MKRARVVAVTFEVICPNCGDSIAEPNTGSFLWETHAHLPKSVTCRLCKTDFELALPKRIAT